MTNLKEKFENLKLILNFCITWMTYSIYSASKLTKIIVISLTLYLHLCYISTVYFGFTELNMDFVRNEVFLTLLYFMTAVGIIQMLIKSYISTYCYSHYKKLIDWIRELYTEIYVEGIMRQIIEKNIHSAFQQSRIIIL